jgi:hypothetical protein
MPSYIHWWKVSGPVLLSAMICGCASGPLLDNPVVLRPDPNINVENPLYIPLGPPSYGIVFEKVLDVTTDYFEVSYANRYDGRIVTYPRIAPGLEQPWKPGSPDFGQRLEATLQTLRHRAEISVQPAPDGGYFVQVDVYKELEDLPKPIRATAGSATFRDPITIERQFEVVDPTVFESNWIPLGHNVLLEQVILQRLKKCL